MATLARTRHDDLRGVPWTMPQPELPEHATILTGNQVFAEIGFARALEGSTLQRILPSEVRVSQLDSGGCSCLTFFARVLIWGSRNSRAD
jgi:hypothetical protein